MGIWKKRAAAGLVVFALAFLGISVLSSPAQAALGSGQFCSLSKQNYYKAHGYIWNSPGFSDTLEQADYIYGSYLSCPYLGVE